MSVPTGSSIPPGRRLSNLQLRTLSGLVLGGAAIGATWTGGWAFKLLCAVFACAIFFEWCAMTKPWADRNHQLISAGLLVLALALALGGWLAPLPVAGGAILLCLLAGLIYGSWRWTLAGFVYALLPCLAMTFLRNGDRNGFWAILLLFAVVWATDIFAYFVGRAVGGPKLAPAISPGKTWSGAVGGAVAGIAAAIGVAYTAGAAYLGELAGLALLLSAVSQAGDLFESWVKRRAGVKDSGKLISGHGGVMDRVDGLVAAAVALYGAGLLLSGGGDPAAWLFRG